MRNFSIPHPLAHAYIVTGGDEEERLAALRQLAAAYLCEGGQAPCGRCRHCVKVERDIHPDVTTLSPAGGKREILVDQARAMRADVYIRPNEGERKVYLIHPADMLKTESQNVLLKVLEEGPPYAAFLLAAAQPGRLLDTIRSRCETITLPPREERPDPELLEQGDGLARLLTEGDEFALACEAVRLEQIIKGGDRLQELLAVTEEALSRLLPVHPRRAAKALRAVKTCRENGVYNPAPGHVFGWLSAEVSEP